MASIKYIGPGEVRIPGIGLVTNQFKECPEHIAEEFESEAGFVVQFEPPLTNPPSPNPLPEGEDKKGNGRGDKKEEDEA